MNYKIHTAPILDAYRSKCDCPMCRIESELETKQLALYTGCGVMCPELRVEVNRLGFCERHFGQLSNGDNALGVALQAKTRTEELHTDLCRPSDCKSAARESDRLLHALSGCVICNAVADTMTRYYETTAALFGQEVGFEPILLASNGHCMRHYAKLLAYAKCAGKRAARYTDILYNLQLRRLTALETDLQGFIDKFDQTKTERQNIAGASTAVPRTIATICSRKES